MRLTSLLWKCCVFVLLQRWWVRTLGAEQLIRYATILLDYADESHQDFDELLIERNRYGAIWLHFAVRPFSNRRKVNFINA